MVNQEIILRYCNFCGEQFKINSRSGILWLEKTNRGRYCTMKCAKTARRGIRYSTISEFKKGQNPELHWNWKGGKQKTFHGYIYIHAPKHPNANSRGYVMEHRLIYEKFLGRYLKKTEVIHHINAVKNDNRLKNLLLFKNQKEHMTYERTK